MNAVNRKTFTGGESVYCINEVQLQRAYEIVQDDEQARYHVKEVIQKIETDFDKNTQAALAFVLVDRLLKSKQAEYYTKLYDITL